MFLINLLLYILAFVGIWFGAGSIVTSTSKFSQKLKLSPFAFSFVFLGLLTSTPEFSVGLAAVSAKDPVIFVGNLLGGIIVLFLVVIPILAVFGNGVSLKHEMGNKTLITTLGVILAPSLLLLDKKLNQAEGIILILLYLIMLVLVEINHGIFDRHNKALLNTKAYSYKDIFKILLGIGMVFVSSNIIVSQTEFFADVLHVSPFIIGLLLLSLGTDLPELTLAARSVISGKKEIAMGDYVGAAAASTLMFGIFTLINNSEIVTESNFLIPLTFIAFALGAFYYFSRTKQFISRNNGLIMLGVYLIFLSVEIFK